MVYVCYVCTYVCMCACVWAYECMSVRACEGQMSWYPVSPLISFDHPYLMYWSSVSHLLASWLQGLSDSAPLLLESQVGCHDYEALTWVLEIQTLLLRLVQQKLYLLSISSYLILFFRKQFLRLFSAHEYFVCKYICVPHAYGVYDGQQRASVPLDLELQVKL